jgi:hypothetical protein
MKATPEDMTGLDTARDLAGRTQGQVARTFNQELMASLFEKIHRLRQP